MMAWVAAATVEMEMIHCKTNTLHGIEKGMVVFNLRDREKLLSSQCVVNQMWHI